MWESSWPQWTIFPVRKQNKVTEQKTRLLELFLVQNIILGQEDPLQSWVGLSHLSHIWVGIFGVNAPVPLHILEGIRHVAPSAAIILRHTIHQVLGTQI